jgi:hypothetical protein
MDCEWIAGKREAITLQKDGGALAAARPDRPHGLLMRPVAPVRSRQKDLRA